MLTQLNVPIVFTYIPVTCCGYAVYLGVQCTWVCSGYAVYLGMQCTWVCSVLGYAVYLGMQCTWVCSVLEYAVYLGMQCSCLQNYTAVYSVYSVLFIAIHRVCILY